eukprot:6173942-Pleurochrysis_carterae.AAC.1
MYPDMPRKQRETALAKEHLAVFIVGIGAPLKDGYPHEMRAADYDDWITPTYTKDGEQFCGLNGDIMVWNPVTKRRHELSSMGLRVTKETLVTQLELSQQTHLLESPYHKMIMTDQIPLSIGGGIGQSRLYGACAALLVLSRCNFTSMLPAAQGGIGRVQRRSLARGASQSVREAQHPPAPLGQASNACLRAEGANFRWTEIQLVSQCT